jgi:Fuc2NAc and GlcNAc transferase
MIVAVIAALVTAAACTWAMIRVAPALKLIDQPNARSSHRHPTARGGGAAIAVAVSVAGFTSISSVAGLWPPLVAALPVAVLGLLDDRFGLSAPLRLGIQLVASVAFVIEFAGTSMGLAALACWALAIAWACNLFNFMDGIDGIAGTEALFICAVAGWLVRPADPVLALLLWIVAASAAGFLLWNWAPARIFMGDAGSCYLGFLIAALAFISVRAESLSLPVWLLLWGPFLADTTVTLVRRMLRGEKWWLAHRSHAYQHLSTRLQGHARATTAFVALNLAVVLPVAWHAHQHPERAWLSCALLLPALLAAAYALGAGKPR